MKFRPGQHLVAWMDPRLEARPSPIAGRGLFACQHIRAGEPVARWGGIIYTRAEILSGKADPRTIAILDEDLYLADPASSRPAEDYSINHSCDSNLWMEDAITLAARRDILPGEEATADYALWLYDADWVLDPCWCGSHLCRGRIAARDWLIAEVQQRYLGHFTPFLNRRIAARTSPSY